MTNVQPEGWQLSSGLRDDIHFTIVSAYFAPTAGYQDGKVTLLHLIGYDEQEEPFTLKMSCGSDWTSSDGGETITHPKAKHINKNSIYGRWIQAAAEIPELIHILASRGDATAASVWVGLVIHCQMREVKFGRGIDAIERLMPVGFTGTSSGTVAAATGQSPTAPANVAPSNVPTAPSEPAQVSAPAATTAPAGTAADRVAAARAKARASQVPDNPMIAKLHELARGANSHDEFMNKAFEIDDVLADDNLAEMVATPTGIYKDARS